MMVISDPGKLVMMQAKLSQLLNSLSTATLLAGLFTNNVTPSRSMTLGTFVEPTSGQFPGYARQAVNGATLWGAPYINAGGFAEVDKTALTIFTPSSIGTGCPIYGYFVYNSTGGTIVWAELNPAGPTTIGLTLLPYLVQLSLQESQFNPSTP